METWKLRAELGVGVDELAVGAEDGHGHGGLQEEDVVVDLLLGDDLFDLAQTLGGFGLRGRDLLAQRGDLVLEVAEELDGLHQDVDFALVDHGASRLRVRIKEKGKKEPTEMIEYSSSIFAFRRSTRRFSDVL